MKTTIIPQIHEIQVKEKEFLLSDFCLSAVIMQLFPHAIEAFDPGQLAGDLPIQYSYAELLPEEYHIEATAEGIEIYSASPKGLEYALFTLSELGRINDGRLQEFSLWDSPALPFRALSDDISRGQISTHENFYAIIRTLARYKYNTYMPYIEDVFQFTSVPAWGRYSDALTAQEWKLIIDYAASWNITVRPIVNLLGHFDKSCCITELQSLALRYKDGRISHVMDPRKPEVRETIKKMLSELVDCFGPGLIHCGGDEPVALTEICGKQEGGRLFIEHYCFISNELEKLGCTMMMYADFFAPPWGDYAVPIDRALELPDGTDFVFWDYAPREEYPFVDALHKHGLNLYLSPGSWTWKRFSCDIEICFANTRGLLKADAGRARGMIMSSWADGGDTLRELAWPGVLVGANFCWSPDSDYDYNTFYALYHKSFFGFNEKQAALLEPAYRHDSIIKRQDPEEFYLETFRDPYTWTAFKDRENIEILQAAMKKAAIDWQSLTPLRNVNAFCALELTIARASFTANKIAAIPPEKPHTVEEAIACADAAAHLLGELIPLRELHRKLWFATNRASEWTTCEAHYDDLYDRLRMYTRDLRLRRFLTRGKAYPEQVI